MPEAVRDLLVPYCTVALFMKMGGAFTEPVPKSMSGGEGGPMLLACLQT